MKSWYDRIEKDIFLYSSLGKFESSARIPPNQVGGQVAPTQKFVWLGWLDVGGKMMFAWRSGGQLKK